MFCYIIFVPPPRVAQNETNSGRSWPFFKAEFDRSLAKFDQFNSAPNRSKSTQIWSSGRCWPNSSKFGLFGPKFDRVRSVPGPISAKVGPDSNRSGRIKSDSNMCMAPFEQHGTTHGRWKFGVNSWALFAVIDRVNNRQSSIELCRLSNGFMSTVSN